MQYLLVSVRGKNEAAEAIKGGARIVDAEYPDSALGKVYPLNISSIKKCSSAYKGIRVSTNIGEKQYNRKTACQSALGVATAGADIIKIGMAKLTSGQVEILLDRATRTVKYWYPQKEVIPAFFADTNLRKIFDPFANVSRLAKIAKIDGILIDTFNKSKGKGLLDYVDLGMIKRFVHSCHKANLAAWIAGSIEASQIQSLWRTGVDVICVRGAACGKVSERSGNVKADLVRFLIPS